MKIKLSNITKYFILVGFVFILCVFYSIMSDKEQTKQRREDAIYAEANRMKSEIEWERKRLEMELQIAKYKAEEEAQKQKAKPKPKPKANIKLTSEEVERIFNECKKWMKENRKYSSIPHEKACTCYAEGIEDFFMNSTKEEVEKYKTYSVHGISVRNKIADKCKVN